MAIPSIQSAILLSFLVLFLGPYLQTAKLCSCSDDHKVGNCHSIERLALLDFKKGVEDPSNMLSSWRLDNEDCCKWHGVGCNNVTGYVKELDLNTIKDLEQTTRLRGGISPALAQLKHLKYLDLSENYFEGRIPQQLGNLSHLHHLDLSNNRFSIQELQFLYHLTSLEYLDLVAILNFTTLQSLDLSATEIQGPIPKAIEQMTSLKTLRLGVNDLTGPIPDVLANLTSLQCLDLEHNHLEGPIPLSFGAFCKLKELYLSRNNISGEITEFVNGIYLCRPNSLLEIFNLGHTKLTGYIPYSLGNLKSLRILHLQETSMNGAIPKSLGQLSELEFPDLSLNAWDGELTEDHFANLANLIGPLFPSWLRNLNQLGIIVLENIGISDKIPNWLASFHLN
ncbi:hypothetical protein Syun_016182 [Stephania yunnanensis]|uniref:Leucine-rich repeat-containing N-terminal plant-type domain-containing protein n=1 Tax=Stephania yunnanensis TaxID=152371 RepID=A0AAP0J5G1_9MAGN